MASQVISGLVAAVFEYDTAKIIHITSKSVGLVNRILQLTILLYVLIWVFIVKKGYQEEHYGVSSTTSKVKGVTLPQPGGSFHTSRSLRSSRSTINTFNDRVFVSSSKLGLPDMSSDRVWDSVDVTVPAEENNAFFVTTNVIVTQNQTYSVCTEKDDVKGALCHNDTDCLPVNKPLLLGHGITNGSCNLESDTCYVKAWCPLENDNLTETGNSQLLAGVSNFTVLIKNFVFFRFYETKRHNILDDATEEFLDSCHYDAEKSPFCPVFRIGDIVRDVHENVDKPSGTGKPEDIYKKGGVISLRIQWDCDLDYNVKLCKPKYQFDRLDDKDKTSSKGYNYRYTHNWFDEQNIERRQLVKAYGILFIVDVQSKAGKFNIIPTLLNLGSGLALLSVSTVICDLVILYIHRQRLLFRTHKYELVTGEDSYKGYENLDVIQQPDSDPI